MNDEYINRLLPTWLATRMASDEWYFGLLLTNGAVIGVSHLNKITQDAHGNIWLDVNLLPANDGALRNIRERFDIATFGAINSRERASINVSHIMAMFELSDT